MTLGSEIGEASTRSITRGSPLVGSWRYLWHARPAVALTAPLIYACLIPFLLLDLLISAYQTVCFPIYGIPKVRRRDYMLFDRGRLRYLNRVEQMNCIYCSYANGLIAYVREISARTEQHWCPIKHDQQPQAPHSRYPRFLPYGDEHTYRHDIQGVRHDFSDLR
jgi:hypothetical protein